MDSRTANQDVSALIEEIKQFMPETYAAIQAKAAAIGNDAFVWVRQGLRGHPDFFYASEDGRVMGTPFKRPGIMSELERYRRLYGDVNIVFFASEGVF